MLLSNNLFPAISPLAVGQILLPFVTSPSPNIQCQSSSATCSSNSSIDVCSDNNSSFISSVESDNGTSLSLNVNDLNCTLDDVSDDDDVSEQSV